MKRSRLIVLTIGCLWASAAGADWPQFLGPARNGASGETALARAWPAGGPKVLWTVPLGAGYAGPAVRDGKVYLLDRVDNAEDVLRCLDLLTGRPVWQYAYATSSANLGHSNGSRTTPAVDEQYVFTVGPHGDFHCISRATHKPVWRKHLVKDFDGKRPIYGISQSPLLHGETVIVTPMGEKASVAAFDKATGKIAWQAPPIGGMAWSSPIVTTLAGVEQVVVISCRNSSAGIRTTAAGVAVGTGRILWQFDKWKCKRPIVTPVVIGDDRLLLSGGYNAGTTMLRIAKAGEAFTVTELFHKDGWGAQMANPLLHEGHVYLNTKENGRDSGLMCIDLSGEVKWQTAEELKLDRGNMLLADGRLFALDRSGTLRMIAADPAGYKELGATTLLGGKSIWSPLVLTDGKLLIRDQKQIKCVHVGAE